MNARKILITTVIATIFNVGCMAEEQIKIATARAYDIYDNGKIIGHVPIELNVDKVNRDNTSRIFIDGIVEKLVIKQDKNPCLFFNAERWKFYRGKKIDEHTVELYNIKDITGKYHGIGFSDIERPDIRNDIKIDSSGIHYSLFRYKNEKILQILGTSKMCYKNETEEEWMLYGEDIMGTYITRYIKFTLGFDKYTLPPQVKNNETQTNQKTRIKIYKFGAPDGFGRTFNTPAECEAERAKLTESHKGLDYSYACEKI
jgi:hypothetical protein